MVEVALEEVERIDLLQDIVGNLLVMGQDIVEGEGGEVTACLEIQELAEREAAQVIALHEPIEFRVFLFQAHHAGAGEDDAQAGILIVAAAQLLAPVGLFEHLVNEEYLSPALPELTGEVSQTSALEIEIVHINVQTLTRAYIKILLGILQEKGGLADATSAFDAYERLLPVYFIHEGAAHVQVRVLNEIGVCSEE